MEGKSLSIVLGAFALAMVLASAAIAGCSLADIVKSDLPATVRNDPEVAGLPPRPSHNESMAAYTVWCATRAAERQQWEANLQKSGELIGAVQAFGNTALEQIVPSLAGLPFGGLAIGALTFGAGLFLNKPGAAKAAQAAIDAAYDEGVKVGGEKVAAGVAAVTKGSGA